MKNRLILGSFIAAILSILLVLCLPAVRNTLWMEGGETAEKAVVLLEPRPELAAATPVEVVTEQISVEPEGRIEPIPDVTRSPRLSPGMRPAKKSTEKRPEPKEIASSEKAPGDVKPAQRKVDNPEGRANWFMEQRMYPFKELPEDARRRAWQQVLDRGEGLGPEEVGTT